MSPDPAITARRLTPADVPAARALAEAVSVHGVYVRNVLADHPRLGPKAVMLAFTDAERLVGLAHFGHRGNLLVLEHPAGSLPPRPAAQAILDSRSVWRIVLGPAPVVAALVELGGIRTIVDRRQVYYRVTAAELNRECAASAAARQVRLAERKDLDALMQAALHLNQSDLRVDPWCVDRDWLKRATKKRIRQRSTYVIGPPGQPMCKLDIGSQGPAGVVLEGVYTWPELRGRGLASALVAAVAEQQLPSAGQVCLHVAEANAAARRSYEKCGMKAVGDCQLMLRR